MANPKPMELTHLRSFYIIAGERSVTRAATHLGLTQPALSIQIKALEAELGVVLFARHRKQMQLTQAVEIFSHHVQTVLTTLEDAKTEMAELHQLLRGRLALATSDTNSAYVLPEVLRQFCAQYQHVQIDIR